MSPVEIGAVVVIVGLSAYAVVRRGLNTVKGEKGSCKSCGDTCACALKDAAKKN